MLLGRVDSFVTGVTEPLEFAFLFVAWPLYFIHALFTGSSLALTNGSGSTTASGSPPAPSTTCSTSNRTRAAAADSDRPGLCGDLLLHLPLGDSQVEPEDAGPRGGRGRAGDRGVRHDTLRAAASPVARRWSSQAHAGILGPTNPVRTRGSPDHAHRDARGLRRDARQGQAGAFAYPAINVTSSQTLNAALRGFAEAESDGIVQVSTGGAEFLSGSTVKDMVTGAAALAEFAHEVAAEVPRHVALHTDHCPKDKLDGFVRPLLAHLATSGSRRGEEPAVPVAHVGRLGGAAGREPRDRRGAARPGRTPPTSSWRSRSASSAARRTASSASINEKLYTTPDDALATVEALGLGENGRYLLAAHVRQRARRLQAGQRQAAPRDPQGDPGGGRRQVRLGGRQAVRPGLPRRLGLVCWRRSTPRSTTAS